MIGQQIDAYQIQKVLGSGGMADVYLAWDQKNQWPVALKMMNRAAMSDPKLQERFKREVALAMKLRHPHLVQVYGWGKTPDERYYMVMEYIDGGSLGHLMHSYATSGKTVPDGQATYLMRRVAGAMAYAHEQGVVHRDLKPANILIRQKSGEPVVTDLGIAVVAGSNPLTGTMELIGTPHYMAPEQASGTDRADERSDVYAMGLILCEMLCGRLPFEAETSWAILNQKITQDPPSLAQLRPGTDAGLVTIVDTCLQRDPARRYASAGALARALDTVLPPGAPPPGPYGRAAVAKGGRKATPPWLWVGGAALTLLLLFGLFSIFNKNPGSEDRSSVAAAGAGIATANAVATQTARAAVVTSPTFTPDAAVDAVGEGVVAGNSLVADAGPTATDQPILPTLTPIPQPSMTATTPPTPVPTLIPTETLTPQPVACAGGPLGELAGAWDRDNLGCPLNGGRSGVWMATESFDGGLMFWREDNDHIYAIFNSGTWAIFDDIWQEGDAEFSCGDPQSPPTPGRGFGKIWCTYEFVRSGLGNAREAETGANGSVQDFDNGTIVRVPSGHVYVLNGDNGTWR